jgi:lipoprotein-releasing system permease protein
LTRPGAGGIRDYDALARRLAATPDVRSATAAVYQTVLLSFGGQARGVIAKGVEAERERSFNEALQRVVAGHADFSPDADGIDALLVGKQIAAEWKLSPGDYVTLTSPQGRLTPFGLIPRTRRFRVAGVFDSGFYDYDENWCFITLAAAQNLSGVSDAVNVIEFRIARPERAGEIARRIEQAAGPGYAATTWTDENKALFRALRLEKLVTAIFVGLITFVAGLNILVVLAMTVTDKARDVAVLMAMGTRRAQIRGIFLWQGISVGAVGTAAGLVIGYAFTWAAGTYHLIPLDPQIYSVAYVPFHPSVWDGAGITVVAMGISLCATLLPARSAAKLLPVEILRYE